LSDGGADGSSMDRMGGPDNFPVSVEAYVTDKD